MNKQLLLILLHAAFLIPLNAQNLIYNGDFETGTVVPFTFYKEPWSGINASVINGELAITNITRAYPDIWKVQVIYTQLPVESGITYRLSFDAYADTVRPCHIYIIGETGLDWNPYFDKTITISAIKTTYEYTFQMMQPSDFSAKLVYALGTSTVSTYFDNISLERYNAVSQIDTNSHIKLTDLDLECITHKSGDITLDAGPNILMNGSVGGGLNFQVFLGRRISVNGDLAAGKDYFHLGVGSIFIPVWFLLSDDGIGSLDDIRILLLSLEHTAIHFPLKNKTEISPYISLLRYRYTYTKTGTFNKNRTVGQFCFATGIRLDKYIGRFTLTPYAEYNIGYKDRISGFIGGINLGVYFPNIL